VVFGLGAAVIALKLQPAAVPTTAIDRNVEQWKRAVIADPQSDVARINLGLALVDAGRTDQARDSFEDALELNAESWMALFQLGLLEATEDPTGALELLERSASAAPPGNRAVVMIAQGDLLMRSGDPEAAAAAFASAIADTPFLIEAHVGLAEALEALGDEKGALEHYREAARFDPSNQEIAEAITSLTKD
jgi:tetratricopeptide (TPR) repeat protein